MLLRRLLLLSLLCLAPGLATAGPDQLWGRAVDGRPGPSELHLRRCESGCAVEVTFLNRHLWGPALTRRFVLELDGIEVAVTVADGESMAPDRIVVEPPPGYVAEPSALDVDEDATGIVRLQPIPMS
jgi:hypothetical protein